MGLLHSSPPEIHLEPPSRRVALPTVRLTWGLFLAGRPGVAVRALGGLDTSQSRLVMRLLGGRHVAEALVEFAWPGRWRAAISATDGLHALTGVGLALRDRRWRRPALTDALIATGFAGWAMRS